MEDGLHGKYKGALFLAYQLLRLVAKGFPEAQGETRQDKIITQGRKGKEILLERHTCPREKQCPAICLRKEETEIGNLGH